MSRHRDFRNLNIDEELDDDALSDGGEEPTTQEEENELNDAFEQVRAIIGSAQMSGLSDKELKDTLWHEYYDVNKTVEWALAEQEHRRAAQERKEAFEYDQSALEYFRSRNMDTNEDQSRVPKIILAQQQAYEQGYLVPEDQEDLDSPVPHQYRPELSTITERSEIITEFSPASASQGLALPRTRRGGADSSRTTSYGEPLEDNSQTQRFFAHIMEQETPRQRPISLQPSSAPESSDVPSIRMSSATTVRDSDSLKQPPTAEKPLPVTPPLSTKRSKLSSLASSRLSVAASSLSASSRDDGTALSGSVKTFPALRPSPLSELAPSTIAPPLAPRDPTAFSISSSAASQNTPSQATGVSEMTAQVQRAIQAALELEAMDKSDHASKPEKPKLTLAQPQSPPPAKGVTLRSLQSARSLAQTPSMPVPQPQRPVSETLKSPPLLKAVPPQTPKPQPPVTPSSTPGELKNATGSAKPMSKLAMLAQQKVSANKAPKLPAPKTEYLVPTANGPTATTAITTSYQSLFSLTDPKRPAFMPKLDVVPLSTPSAGQQVKTSKLAMKVKKANEKPAAKVPIDEVEETTTAPLSPIFQTTSRSPASPSAFASVLVHENLMLFKPRKKNKEKSSDRKSGNGESEAKLSSRPRKSQAIVASLAPPSAFTFDSPSPDDIVFSARRGTSLSQSKHAKSATTSTLSSKS
ncbi:hypothetical protein P691DRAFT_256246 [Macrolepiota fuliginosa MF-IS2]|uniref:HBS1-like protein N-terminal domain-containing protein n=1 Tax=Macrolepiota fuliginosa MF-IS2 TaxID=1400762 RepID=A0A9P5XIP0_9AGAR|nr:hypothetical protein P691DRAFT_256246 [Macrolepiota fuliginosa MF-IS2]